MEQRINIQENGQQAMKAVFGLAIYLAKSSLDQNLLSLIYFRVSQINGCAGCLDMHSKELRLAGENEQRLYLLEGWRQAPLYTTRERAALAWAEAVTNVREGHVPDEIYHATRQEFSETELIELTVAVITINSYNRLNIAFRLPVGQYVPSGIAANAK